MSMSVCGRRRSGWSTPARSGLAASSPPGATWRDRRTCGCSSRSRASTGGPGRLLETAEDAPAATPTRRCATFLARGRFTAYFQHALHGAAGRRGVVLRPGRWRSTTRRATSSPSSSTTACSASSGRRSGAPSPAAPASTSSSVGAGLPDVRLGTKVTSVLETADGVEITDGNGEVDDVRRRRHRHPPGPGPGDARRADRGCSARCSRRCPTRRTPPSCTPTPRVLPPTPSARASWNYQRPPRRPPAGSPSPTTSPGCSGSDTDDGTSSSPSAARTSSTRRQVIETMEYEHPIYTPELRRRAAPAARDRDPDGSAFAGAYHGWGFHEDGARSGVAAAEQLGRRVAETDRTPRRTVGGHVVYATTIRHHAPPAVPARVHLRLAHLAGRPRRTCPTPASVRPSFEARDHLGDPDRTIRENVDAFLATQGVDLDGGRIADARQRRARSATASTRSACSGATTAPASSPASSSRCTTPTATGTPTSCTPTSTAGPSVDKAMYVSPFHDVDGRYEIAVPVPRRHGARSSITLQQRRLDRRSPPRSTGYARPGPSAAARRARAALRGSARIRVHGIWLWAATAAGSGPVPTTPTGRRPVTHA